MTGGAAADTIVRTGKPVSLVPAATRVLPVETATQDKTVRRTFVLLSVTGYQPPLSGRVEAVVTAITRDGREALEVGRFAVFPNQPIVAGPGSSPRMHLFEVPGCPIENRLSCVRRVSVELMAVQGTGEGASLTLGPLEIEIR